MSIFKASGIILKIHKTRDARFLYTIFSSEYGKIISHKKYSKTEKSLDLGYIVNFEVTMKQDSDISSIRNIIILSEYTTAEKSFSEINSYLELLAMVAKNTVPGIQNLDIFNLVKSIHSIKDSPDMTTKLLLAKLKLIQILGNLSIENKDATVTKILKFIHNNKSSDILRLSGIDQNIIKKLEQLV